MTQNETDRERQTTALIQHRQEEEREEDNPPPYFVLMFWLLFDPINNPELHLLVLGLVLQAIALTVNKESFK